MCQKENINRILNSSPAYLCIFEHHCQENIITFTEPPWSSTEYHPQRAKAASTMFDNQPPMIVYIGMVFVVINFKQVSKGILKLIIFVPEQALSQSLLLQAHRRLHSLDGCIYINKKAWLGERLQRESGLKQVCSDWLWGTPKCCYICQVRLT